MCGLSGAVGQLEKGEKEAFANLLFMSCFRGMDSTGLASGVFGKTPEDPPNFQVFKQPVPAPDFIDMMKVKSAISDSNMFLMGHARSRTVGEVNKKNAQPFDMEHVIGTHNGTLSWQAKNRLEGPRKSCGTDSEALYSRLNDEGFDKVAELTEKDDAMALAWIDKTAGVFNLYRNEKRPLYYALNKKNTTLFYASEAGMLYLALNRNGIEFNKIKLLPENLHLSYKMPSKVGEPFPQKPESRFCHQSFKPAVVATTTTYYGGTGHRSFTPTQNGQTANVNVSRVGDELGRGFRPPLVVQKNTNIPSLVTNNSKVFDLTKFRLHRMTCRAEAQGGDYYKSEAGRVYSQINFENKTFEGCAVCGSSPSWGEPVRFLRDESFLCAPCVSEAKEQAVNGQVSGTALLIFNQLNG